MNRVPFILKFVFLGILLISATYRLNAQGFLKTSNKQIVNGKGEGEEVILRGIGLGGWMLQEGYMMQTADFANTQHELKTKIADLIGQAGMEKFYNAWLTNYMQEVDVDSLAVWGFNSIRLPLHYNLFTLPIEKEPVQGENTWLQKGFDLTDSLLKWCEKKHIYLILDLHAAPGGQGKDQPIADYDPSKPSLWESELNRKKTVALWKKLAEHYASNQWIGGYDLINETNWDLTGNAALKNLYKEITDSIRKVDKNHIIFIEGNWFANDFNGLTPPWDDNMVYSFHKYWTFNTKNVIQWMIDIRDKYNVPIWLGESGENSNTWFKECITLMEENKIGWAWWPFKKIGSISGPLSAIKTTEYETLLNYWKGNTAKPSVDFATNALMQMAENLKMKNCEYHPDLIDAMFRQIKSNDTKPYKSINIPGVIYAPNFDLGANGFAYYDKDVADYHLSANSYTSWNLGWTYRNDGVDIEPCTDLTYSNAYNISHTENGEWVQYTVNTSKTALYNINIRTASEKSTGVFRIQEDGVDIGPAVKSNPTGGWQIWQNTVMSNVVLTQGIHKLKFLIDTAGFNVNSFKFTESGAISSIATEMVSAITDQDSYTIHLNVNKPLSVTNIATNVNNFKVSINGTEILIQSVSANTSNPRVIDIKITYRLIAGNTILVSYLGNQIAAADGTLLSTFTDKQVENSLPKRFTIPTKIQAEDFYFNNGLSAETCTDSGGGADLGYTDGGDYLDYLISVDTKGTYLVNYRISSLNAAGQVELQLIGETVTSLHTIDLPVTGGWQTWSTVSKEIQLPAGQYLLRLLIKKSGFNLNWFSFDLVSGIKSGTGGNINIKVFPNPVKGILNLVPEKNQNINYQIYNMMGQSEITGSIYNSNGYENRINLSGLNSGLYLLKIETDKGFQSYKIMVSN